MDLTRALVATQATLTRTFYVGETPTDATGSVAVALARLDGSVPAGGVGSGTAVHSGAAGSGTYTYTVPPQPQLDAIVATWTATVAGGQVTVTDMLEIVGGYLFGLADARTSDGGSLNDPVKYPTASLITRRTQVEQDAEMVTGCAWVPRYARVLVSGTGRPELVVPHSFVRKLRSAAIAWNPGQQKQVLAADVVAQMQPTETGLIVWPVMSWPYGPGTVLLEYEHGQDTPPEGLKQAALKHLRAVLKNTPSSVPDRASAYTVFDGATSQTYRLTMPGRRATGIPDIDAAYEKWAISELGFA
jgi:hypothetical protein